MENDVQGEKPCTERETMKLPSAEINCKLCFTHHYGVWWNLVDHYKINGITPTWIIQQMDQPNIFNIFPKAESLAFCLQLTYFIKWLP